MILSFKPRPCAQLLIIRVLKIRRFDFRRVEPSRFKIGSITTRINSISAIKARPLKLLLISLWLVLNVGLFSVTSHAQTMENPAFSAAMAHIEAGEWQQAERVLTLLLSKDPELHRARLELGLVYVQLNAPNKAQEEFEILLNKPDVPDPVKQNIRQLITQNTGQPLANRNVKTQVPQSEAKSVSSPHQFNGSLQLSLGYDDNVRYSSADYFLEDDPYLDGFFLELDDESLVYVAPDGYLYDEDGNLLFENDGFVDLGDPYSDFPNKETLYKETLDRENSFVEAKVGLNHLYSVPSIKGLEWHNKLGLQATKNNQHSEYNRFQTRLETGLAWRASPQWKYTVSAHYRLLQRDGKVQIRAHGLAPQLTYFNQLGSWTLGLEWLQRKYEDSITFTGEFENVYAGFSNSIRGISGKWSKLFLDNNLLLLAKLEYTDSNADDGFNYKGTRFTLASVYNFTPYLSLLLSANEFHQDYSEITEGPLDDDISTLSGKLTYSYSDNIEWFIAGERALRTSDIYGDIKSDKSLLQIGVELAF